MTTLQATTHTGRLDAGDAVLTAAGEIDTKAIAAKLTAFRKAHGALGLTTKALTAAEEKLRAAQARVAESDVTQDASLSSLADALVGIGQPRTLPFKGLSTQSPSTMQKLGYAIEAKAILALVGKVQKRKGLTPAVTAACKEAERAARAVLAALEPLAKLEGDVARARTRRDALTQPWETAFAKLKRAARTADDDGPHELFDTLFRTTAPEPKRPRAKKKPAEPAKPA